MKKVTSAFIAISLFCVFTPQAAKAVELAFHNNLHESEEGSKIEIEDAESAEAPGNKVKFFVMPGEKKAITSGNATFFIVSIIYPRHKQKYMIRCPKDSPGSAVITPVMVHNNELPAGCKVEKTGHWSKRSGMSWRGL